MTDGRELLSDFPVVLELPTLWGDQDSFGHVNNLVYLRWCETVRVEYLARIGFWPPLPPAGVGPILASVACDYRRPLTHPDTILVGARVTRIGNSSFRMQHAIVSQSLGVVAAEADSTLVALDYSQNKAVRLPEAFRRAIEELESKPIGA